MPDATGITMDVDTWISENYPHLKHDSKQAIFIRKVWFAALENQGADRPTEVANGGANPEQRIVPRILYPKPKGGRA